MLDVGANAGYFTLLAASRVGARGRVVAFEPVPGNAEVVRKQCALNQCSVVTVESLAVGDRDGVATFVQEENNPNSHLADVRLSHASTRPVRKFDVQVTTLDSYLLDHSVAPDVVKVDVEGGEVGVLKGARDVLAARRTRWLVSTHSATLRSEVRRVFAEFGYSISELPGFEHEVIAMP